MAANTAVPFTRTTDFQLGAALINTAASVVYDISGTIGTDIYKIYTADATEGSFVQRVRFKYFANGTTTSVAATMRVWISSTTSGTPTISTSAFFDEIALPATGALSTTTQIPCFDVPFNVWLPPSYTILCKITVSQSANTGYSACVVAGKY